MEIIISFLLKFTIIHFRPISFLEIVLIIYFRICVRESANKIEIEKLVWFSSLIESGCCNPSQLCLKQIVFAGLPPATHHIPSSQP